MTETVVRFLLVERDAASEELIEQLFHELKISNPLLVARSAAECLSLLGPSSGNGSPANVVLVGSGVAAEERATVLEGIAYVQRNSALVISLGENPVCSAQANGSAGERGHESEVRLACLAQLLEHLGVVITTTAAPLAR